MKTNNNGVPYDRHIGVASTFFHKQIEMCMCVYARIMISSYLYYLLNETFNIFLLRFAYITCCYAASPLRRNGRYIHKYVRYSKFI